MPSPRVVVESAAARTENVITTRECLRLGADRDWVERQVTSGRWRRVARGVLVTYSGPPTWRTRATAALAHAGRGGLLSHDAAAFLHGITTTPPRVIDVTIPRDRRVVSVPGVRMHRRARRRATRRRGLAVVAAGDAVLDLVERAQGVDRVVGVLCDAVRAGIDADAVLQALAHRPAQRRRRLVLELLGEVAGGIESPLEYRYHRDVERRHGLPRSVLQRREVVGGRWIRADARYVGLGVRTELDGELAHPGGRTDADTWRDNAVLIAAAELTLRYRWRHVVAPCETAGQVAAALRSRGWDGVARACGPGCAVDAVRS